PDAAALVLRPVVPAGEGQAQLLDPVQGGGEILPVPVLVDHHLVGDGVAPAPGPQGAAADAVGLHIVEGVQPVGVGGIAHHADAAQAHRETGGAGGQGVDAAAQIVLIGVEGTPVVSRVVHADEDAELTRVAGGVVQDQPVDLP